jgi:glycosyltransferase involved in cell wall biosynthesis
MVLKDTGISIFFPVYNDWGTIADMVALSIGTADKIAVDYEIILVDDGSDNKTQEVLNLLATRFPRLKVIRHPYNMGYGAALRTGFAACQKEFIFYTDGDAQYDVEELPGLIQAMEEDIDIVNGYKVKRRDPWYRIIAGTLYNFLCQIMFTIPIRDVNCDFRLIRRSVFDKVKLEINSGAICIELIAKARARGLRFAQIPVSHYCRPSGKSQFFNLKNIWETGGDLIKLWWQHRLQY